MIRPLTTLEACVTLIITFVLSLLTWRYIEAPFRGKNGLFTRKTLFILTALTSLLIGTIGFTIALKDGFPQRFNSTVLGYALTKKGLPLKDANISSIPVDTKLIGAEGTEQDVSFLLWGDSHATSISPALDYMGKKKGKTGLFIREAGCLPGLHMENEKLFMCQRALDAVSDYLQRHDNIKHIYLSARWSAYPRWWQTEESAEDTQKNETIFKDNMLRSIQTMNKRGYTVTIVKEPPYVKGWNVPLVLARNHLFNKNIEINIPLEAHKQQQAFVTSFFNQLEMDGLITVIDPTQTFCDFITCTTARNGKSLYFDDDHMSVYGAQLLQDQF